MSDGALRTRIRAYRERDEALLLRELIDVADFDTAERAAVSEHAARLVRTLRKEAEPTLMEAFLGEYGLSTAEGIALMCLAEALLRVPDQATIDDLIADKITAGDWGAHAGRASSALVNASTWALLLTGRVLADEEDAGIGATLHALVRRIGEPMVRAAVAEAMAQLGRQFVLGETIEQALRAAGQDPLETFSYDMLGEAARTDADARRYHVAYADAITFISRSARGALRDNPGISVKLSALHPRYESAQKPRMFDELVARTRSLAVLAATGNLGFNIDAEEMERLEIGLDVIEAVLAEPALASWEGFGVVVQAYGRRAMPVIEWLYELACKLDRRIMVRLVKGAYWDSEIKRAQVLGLADYPVLTRKVSTDVSYLAAASALFDVTDRIYPQFATHNAHTAVAVAHLAGRKGISPEHWEYQRLHGMGAALHGLLRREFGARSRVYAPVGVHRDLLAYLVRRLLENGANSSFVHQLVDERVAPEDLARDPIAVAERLTPVPNPAIAPPAALFPGRRNSTGLDLQEPDVRGALEAARARWAGHTWRAHPLSTVSDAPTAPARPVHNPARPSEVVGWVRDARPGAVRAAIGAARDAAGGWGARDPADRASLLDAASDRFEARRAELIALLAREAGKTEADALAEVREAVDFLREYARQVRSASLPPPRGVIACISPWNFPLAIFTGQVAAALATGNTVLAKPAEQTPLTGFRASELLLDAGVPRDVLQFLPGDGPQIGAALASDPRIDGICFTGSLETAQSIHRSMAEHLRPAAMLIAETGGINAMLVDSTALPEQAVRDVITSAFDSAGQRCSAARVLYLQEEIADDFLAMLFGAMDALALGDPWQASTDIGPLIDAAAAAPIRRYLRECEVLHQVAAPAAGHFVPPTVVAVDGIEQVEREIFGPVLHVARFAARDVPRVIDAINAAGSGLTFAIHTRLDDRVQLIVDRLRVGNIYVNRNQIGAVVGSQPFGGEGLSGTGPKAGGPHYLRRFCAPHQPAANLDQAPPVAAEHLDAAATSLDSLRPAPSAPDLAALRARYPDSAALAALAGLSFREEMPGPTGERNVLRLHPRGTVLCLGPGEEICREQMLCALGSGCAALVCAAPGLGAEIDALRELGAAVQRLEGVPPPEALTTAGPFALVARAADDDYQRALRRALAARPGPIILLQVDPSDPLYCLTERHVCTDTTASGGNATLMATSAAADLHEGSHSPRGSGH